MTSVSGLHDMQMNNKTVPLWRPLPLLLMVIFLPLAVAEPPGKAPADNPLSSEPARQASTGSQLQTPAIQVPATPASPAQRMPLERGPTDKQPGFTPTEKIGADVAVSFPVDI